MNREAWMHRHRNWRISLLVLLAIGASEIGAFAQVPTGTIEGTVKAQTDTTSSRGAFQFTHLNVGIFRVEVSKAGFKISVLDGIKLDASTEYSVPPVTLEVGAVTEAINIEADADMERTAGAELTDTVEGKQIEELPILDRNPMNLLELQAGVSQNRRSGTVINGQRQSFSNVTLDGINIQDNYIRSNTLDYTPNYLVMSQVQEFTTTTQNAGPQAGTGSSQVSVVTPSGTNNWHGEGFWYYRSDKLAANDWFNDANGVGKPNLLQNQGGGDVGGPVMKDKLFVYGAYELLRRRQQLSTDTTVLTSPARSGIFQWQADCTVSTCPSGVTPGSLQSVNLLTLKGVSVDPFIANLLTRVPTTLNNASIGDGLNTGGY